MIIIRSQINRVVEMKRLYDTGHYICLARTGILVSKARRSGFSSWTDGNKVSLIDMSCLVALSLSS